MVLKRCERGHFYNGDKYVECPRCAAKGLRNLATPHGNSQGAQPEPVTAAISGHIDGQAGAHLAGQTTQMSAAMYQQEDDSVTASILPQTDDPVTMPLMDGPAQQTTGHGSLQEAVNAAAAPVVQPDDDEKTVSFYQSKTGIDPVAGWLVCIEGDDFGGSFTIKSGRNFIGRAANMDIVLHGDHSISREKHAIILYEPKRREFIAQAGESRELFYLNDEVVLNPVRLKAHDVLTIGNTSLMFFPCCGEDFSWDDFKKQE